MLATKSSTYTLPSREEMALRMAGERNGHRFSRKLFDIIIEEAGSTLTVHSIARLFIGAVSMVSTMLVLNDLPLSEEEREWVRHTLIPTWITGLVDDREIAEEAKSYVALTFSAPARPIFLI